MLHALIMAGGGGTRFWPRSRAARPKQFLTLAGDRSLLQQAADRLEAQIDCANIWVLTADRHCEEARHQLPAVSPKHIVGEPAGRDTAACIGLGAALIAQTDPNAIMLVSPADHVIEPAESFRRAIQAATLAIKQYPDALVTFGIPPTYPATGYGYVRRGQRIAEFGGLTVSKVESFREKPESELAEQYLSEGGYFWNAGIFVWKPSTVLAELKRNKPALHEGIMRIAASWQNAERERVLRDVYPTLERVSIDYAVMEHATTAMVLEAPFRWDDVGSWNALERLHAQDAHGNTVVVTHAGIDTHGCVVVGEPGKLIATAGVSDLLIIQDGDVVLVADRRDEAAVKRLVEQLGKSGLDRYL